jgi:hypothetical protein
MEEVFQVVDSGVVEIGLLSLLECMNTIALNRVSFLCTKNRAAAGKTVFINIIW